MARPKEKLTALEVSKTKTPGMYGDGGGLWLQVTSAGAKSWIFRYSLKGKPRYMGLGSSADVSLLTARKDADACRTALREGKDPIEARIEAERKKDDQDAKEMSFKDCAAAYLESHKPGWRNPKHSQQWENTLSTYAYGVFGSLPVASIDTGLVMKALDPIWATKTETASRVRGRIEAVLDWARARGHRSGENPARWRGHLDQLLPKRAKVQRVEHHPALSCDDLAGFVEAIRSRNALSALALEFVILTATRTSETLGARWSEFDLKQAVWTIPAARTKASREHRVPLSARALEILEAVAPLKPGTSDKAKAAYVFPGQRANSGLSSMALLVLLRRMERTDITVHGFRSTFRDWAAERTNFPREVAEMALGHTIGDKVEAAYRRGDLFEKRRKLMEAWAKYCAVADSKIDAGSINSVIS